VSSPAADGGARLLSCRVACQGQVQSHGEASAVFIDAASHRYLRDQQGDHQVLLRSKKEEPTNLLRSVLTLSVIDS